MSAAKVNLYLLNKNSCCIITCLSILFSSLNKAKSNAKNLQAQYLRKKKVS